MATNRDQARDWITRWEQLAPEDLRAELARRGIAPRHCEHHLGELKVVPGRRYRFDWAIPVLQIAVEVDGGNRQVRWSEKKQQYVAVGRHTQDSDYEKRNIAVAAGYRVFAFTTSMLRSNPTACVEQVATLIRRFLDEN
jgi:very-short-patch-repair endonuclease